MDRLHTLRHPASLERIHPRVAECLAYEDMMEVPEDFETFSLGDYRRRARLHPDMRWQDACPAYALALATQDAYRGRLDLAADGELEAQWDELRGGSALEWPIVRAIVKEAWRWLAQPRLAAVRH